MSSMSNEVDYRLARIIFADMCEKRVIRTRKETGIVQAALLERYDPPFAFLESDTHSALSEDDFTRLMGTKLVCGRCGRNYGFRPWHSGVRASRKASVEIHISMRNSCRRS